MSISEQQRPCVGAEPAAAKNFYVEPELDLDISPAHELEDEPQQAVARIQTDRRS